MIENMESMATDAVEAIAQKATSILARRAAGAAAAPSTVPVSVPMPAQSELFEPEPDPDDGGTFDIKEKLKDGSPRYIQRKEAPDYYGGSETTIRRLLKEHKIGFQIRSKWYIDRKKFRLHVRP